MNKGLMPNQNTGTSKFEMQELPQEIARAVNSMNINEISKPFIMVNAKGKEVCAIVKLKSRIKGHKATLADDFQTLKENNNILHYSSWVKKATNGAVKEGDFTAVANFNLTYQ